MYLALAHLEQEVTELLRAIALGRLPVSLNSRSGDGE
jgi:hypothetical protein